MKIEVNRDFDGDDLVFTIRCSDPNAVPFDSYAMMLLDDMSDNVKAKCLPEHVLTHEIEESIHALKVKAFERMRSKIASCIENHLYPRYQHMAQEIYNWIYDLQKDDVRAWMLTFDPQRTKYYFDNDPNPDQDRFKDELLIDVE